MAGLSFGLDLLGEFGRSRARRSQLHAEQETILEQQEEVRAELESTELLNEFQIAQMRKAGLRSRAEVEASLAEIGQDLDVLTTENLISITTEIALETEMAQRRGKIRKEQLKREGKSLGRQARAKGKQSRRTFFGIL